MMAKRKCLVNIRCYETAIWLWQVSLLMAEPELSLSNRLRQCLLSECVDRCPPSCLIPFFCVCVHSTQICCCGNPVLFFFHITCVSQRYFPTKVEAPSVGRPETLRWMALERFDPGISRFLLGMECFQCLCLSSQKSYSTEGPSVSSA